MKPSEAFKAACLGELEKVVALCRAMVRDYPGIGWESTLREAEERLARKVGPGPLTLAMGKVADEIPF